MIDMVNAEDPPLGYLVHRLAAALRADVTTSVLAPLELSFPQYICLRQLAAAPGRSNAELAREAMVSPQAMNTVVHSLQARGLVTRPREVSAGRSRPAELTAAGEALLEQTNTGISAAEQRVLAPLSDDDQRQLRRLLRALR